MIGLLFLTGLAIVSSHKYDESLFPHHDEYVKVCGWDWQPEFIRRQELIRTGETRPRYVIAVPVQQGLADIIHGYLSAFILALATDRAFLVARVVPILEGTHGQSTVEFGYHSKYIEWKAPKIAIEALLCLLPPYLSENVPPCNQTVSLFTENTTPLTRKTIKGINGVPFNYEGEDLATHGQDFDVLLTAMNRGNTIRFVKNALNRNKYNFTDHTAFSCMFNFLFRTRHEAFENKVVEKRLVESNKDPKSLSIAMQIRHSNVDDFLHCANSLMLKYESEGYKILLLVVTAHVPLQEHIVAKYGDIVLLPSDTPKGITPLFNDRHNNPDSAESTDVEEEEADRQSMLDSARDLHLISLTDIQIVSGQSGFGIVGAMMKLTSKHVIYNIEQGRPLRDCAATPKGDPPSMWAGLWSNL